MRLGLSNVWCFLRYLTLVIVLHHLSFSLVPTLLMHFRVPILSLIQLLQVFTPSYLIFYLKRVKNWHRISDKMWFNSILQWDSQCRHGYEKMKPIFSNLVGVVGKSSTKWWCSGAVKRGLVHFGGVFLRLLVLTYDSFVKTYPNSTTLSPPTEFPHHPLRKNGYHYNKDTLNVKKYWKKIF